MTRYHLVVAAALLLASCQQEPASPNGGATQPKASSAGVETPPAMARKVEEKSEAIEFSYGWPAEAAAIPALAKQLEEELGRDRIEVTTAAKEDKLALEKDGASFFSHSYSKEWQLAGNTPRLLSMVAEVSTFTGGAHPNTDYDGLLWDRQANSLVGSEALFLNGARGLAALKDRYCNALDAARRQKRGEVIQTAPDDFMNACPPIAEQTLVAADTNGNGKFDTLQIWLPPSVAGPYAEGNYQVDLKIDAATLATFKPEYRNSFEA